MDMCIIQIDGKPCSVDPLLKAGQLLKSIGKSPRSWALYTAEPGRPEKLVPVYLWPDVDAVKHYVTRRYSDKSNDRTA